MVWLVVTVNGVYYLGDSLDYVKLPNSEGRGKKRFAKLLGCRMYNRRWDPVDYPSCCVHTRYIIFAEQVKLKKDLTFDEINRWFKKYPEAERIK